MAQDNHTYYDNSEGAGGSKGTASHLINAYLSSQNQATSRGQLALLSKYGINPTYTNRNRQDVANSTLASLDTNPTLAAKILAGIGLGTPEEVNAFKGIQTTPGSGVTAEMRANDPASAAAQYAKIDPPNTTTAVAKTTTPTTTSITLLKQGSGTSAAPDESVRAIQKQLGITADGIFGPQTKSAIMAFQQKNGLVVDGIVGPQTQAALAKSTGTLTQGQSVAGGIVNYNTETGAKLKPGETTTANPTGKVLGVTTSPKDEIQNINDSANSDQEKELDLFKESLGTKVDTSDSSKLIDSLVKTFEKKEEADKPKSLEQQFAEKKAELGVDAKEIELNGIDAQISKLDSDFKTLQDTETNRQVSVTQINRRKSDEQIKYEAAKRDLVDQRNSVANELNQKYSTINTIMQYAGQDINNAQQDYESKFNQAISLINLTKNVEESQKSDMEKLQDNTKANLNVIMSALKGKDYSTLDAGTRATITKMESQAGLPAGFTKFVLDNATDEPVVSIGSEFTDASGSRQVPIYTKNPTTGLITAKTINLGSTGTNDTDNLTLPEKKTVFGKFLKTGIAPSGEKYGNPMGSDGFTDPDVYITAFKEWTGTTAEFLSAFPPKQYVNPLSYKLLPASIRPADGRSA